MTDSLQNPESEKIKVFRAIFMGREDAYGLESSPSPITVREPLTDSLIHDHLKGSKRIGVFLIQKDNKVKAACIDLDYDDTQKLERIVVALINNGFFPYIERSKSRGYHVWIFFDEPIDASIVRKVLSRILKEAGIENIEIFPKQDSLSQNNGLGNYVFLPLHGQSVQHGRTVFLNAQFQPYENQWEHLSKIHRTKSENILSMAEEIREEPKAETSNSRPEDSLDVAKYLIHYNIPFQEKRESTRTIYQFLNCPWGANHTTGDGKGHAAIIQGIDGKITFHCKHAHCENKKWADARKVISGDAPIFQFCEGYSQTHSDLKQSTVDRGLPKDLFQIIDEPEKEQTPLIEALLYPGDKGFIVSTYKLGKTLFMMQMALCLSMGVPFLGFAIPRARKVLYIRFELKDVRFKKRLNIMLPALGGREKVLVTPFFHMTRGFDIKKEKDFSWLLDMIYKFEPEVLFLDPFYKLSLSTDLKKDDGSTTITRFDNLMGRFPELNVSTAHHVRKQTSGIKDDSWDCAYGSVWFFADMDFEIRLSRKGNQKDTFVFSHISNDVSIENFTFKRNPASLLYELETTEDKQSRWLKDTERVIEQVRNGGDAFKQKGNLKTWLQSELVYARRDAEDFLNFLFENKRLVWIGKTPKRGRIEASESGEDSNQEEHENDLFS